MQSAKCGVRGVCLALGALCLVGGTAVAWWLWPTGERGKDAAFAKKEAGRIKEVKPAAAPQYKPEKEAPKVDDGIAKRRAFAAKLKNMPPDQRFECIYQEMVKSPIDYTPTGKRIYATATEQMLDWVFSTTVGDLPPLVPDIPEYEMAHMTEILINKIKVNEEDDEATKESKEIVQQAKKELIEYITNGGSPDEFLQYYRGQLEQAHMQFEEAKSSVIEVMKQDPDLAEDYLKSVNKKLIEKGIKPVRIHPKMAAKYGVTFEAQGE